VLTDERIAGINALTQHSPPETLFLAVVDLLSERADLGAEVDRLRSAIAEHHAQKADDRCAEDDDRLYAAAGLPPCDRRVGDKAAMLANCARYIENRCEGGGWPSYAEMESQAAEAREGRDALVALLREFLAAMDLIDGRRRDDLFIALEKAVLAEFRSLGLAPAAGSHDERTD